MLVCNVSLRPPRRAISSEIAEVSTAVDTLGSGNVVFATLIDDPASVRETVDAYLGEIMLEAASASDIADGSIPVIYVVNLTETATAAEILDGASAVIGTTLDPATATTNVTVSNGGRTATHTTTSNTVNGTGVRSASLKTTGKYYFEVTLGSTHSNNDGVGIVSSVIAGDYSSVGSIGNNAVVTNGGAGFLSRIYANGSSSGKNLGSDWTAGDIFGCAFDLDNRKAWFRKNGGNWNGLAIGSENPATNTGGVTIQSGSFAPVAAFGTAAQSNDSVTMNFGQASYSMAVPSGFGTWPA